METRAKRYAAHKVIDGSESLEMCVVEVVDGYVADYYTFTEELPFTEWLGGTINIIGDGKGNKIALWENEKRL